MYYFLLILGFLSVLIAVAAFIFMYVEKDFKFLNVFKTVCALLFGVLILVATLPSLKSIILKDYDVISGNCTIEVDSFGRSASATFEIIETGELYDFYDIPDLDAYGKSIPYYCKLTVTKDHNFEIGYEIYDVKSRKLILKKD